MLTIRKENPKVCYYNVIVSDNFSHEIVESFYDLSSEEADKKVKELREKYKDEAQACEFHY